MEIFVGLLQTSSNGAYMPGLYEMKIPLKKSECVMFRAVQCLPSAVPPARGGGWDNWPMGAVAGTAVPGPGVPPRPAETLAGGWWQPPLAPRPWRDHFLRQVHCTVLYCTVLVAVCCVLVLTGTVPWWGGGWRLWVEDGGGGAEQTRRTTIRMPEIGTC